MTDSQAKSSWEKENVLKVLVKVNRNQNPQLFDLLQKADSKSGLARELMNRAVSQK
jgi:hypothetical protein